MLSEACQDGVEFVFDYAKNGIFFESEESLKGCFTALDIA
jgi:hypothetical protein